MAITASDPAVLDGLFGNAWTEAHLSKIDNELLSAMLVLAEPYIKRTKLSFARASDDELQNPVADVAVSSKYGLRRNPFGRSQVFHHGIDFVAPAGTPVLAAGPGVVIKARYQRDYGQVIEIDHGEGRSTLYAHGKRLLVREGDRVSAGQQIATVGSTGRSTGPHLHFEVRFDGRRVDPLQHLSSIYSSVARNGSPDPSEMQSSSSARSR